MFFTEIPNVIWKFLMTTGDNLLRLHFYDTLYFILTTAWISLGGLVQTIAVIVLLCKGDSRLRPFRVPLRVLLCLSAPILLAPVVTNVFGAYLIICDGDNATEDLLK